jgi:hypothetical protein
MELASLQKLLYRLITAPGGVDEGLAHERSAADLASLVRGDDRLSAHDRLGIYANAYFYRLLEVCREDFPATAAILGDADFHNLITGYLVEHPPTEPSIHYAGRDLADFLKGHPLSAVRPFLPDLARLERTLVEVFHAADAIALDAASLASVEPSRWPTLRIALHPAARIVDLAWHVERAVRAVEADSVPQPPPPAALKLLVWRHADRVHYRELEQGEAGALTRAGSGATFGEICTAVAQETGAPDPAPLITRFLRRWVSDGLLLDPGSP